MNQWPEDLLKRTGKPSRKQGDTGRSYLTGPGWWFPSVTTIKSGTQSKQSQLKLIDWANKNPGAREDAAARGTHIHACAEYHVTGQPYEVDPQYEQYWTGMPDVLDQFSRVIWAERPLNGDFGWTIGADDIARVWAYETDQETGEIRGFAGAPDLIGIAGGKTTLADYKTSNSPYCRYFPDKGLAKSDPKEFRKQMLGWRKYKNCAAQLAAYSIAIKETLGIEIEQAVVIACVPELEKPQLFKLSRNKLNYLEAEWWETVRKYYVLHPAPDQDDPVEELPIAA